MKVTLKSMPFLLVAMLIAMAGCRQQEQASADNANPAGMSQSQAKQAIADVTVGHQMAADGSIAADQKGNNFSAAQPVYIAFKIGKAPAGTPVTVDWYGPDGQQLASDQKTVERGNSELSFTSKDTSAWVPGDYRVDIAVGGQKVDAERFSIVAPEKAENTATKPGDAVSNVTVGHKLGADGTIAAGQEGKDFVPGQPVVIVYRAGSALPGTSVAIEWYGPDNQKLGSDQHQVNPGETVLHFATSTGDWGLGDYRADLLVNGQKVDTEHFSIVNRNKADKTGK
jgi:hypothetical protein